MTTQLSEERTTSHTDHSPVQCCSATLLDVRWNDDYLLLKSITVFKQMSDDDELTNATMIGKKPRIIQPSFLTKYVMQTVNDGRKQLWRYRDWAHIRKTSGVTT